MATDGLYAVRHQAITWISSESGPSGNKFSEILIKKQNNYFNKMRTNVSSAKCRPFCWCSGVLEVRSKYKRIPSLRSHCTNQDDNPCLYNIMIMITANQFDLTYAMMTSQHFPPYWPFVRGNHRSPVNSPNKGQWGGALMFSLICAWINAWVNNREAGDLRRHRGHFDLNVMAHNISASLSQVRFV